MRVHKCLRLRDALTQAPGLDSFDRILLLDQHSIEVEVPETLTINDLIGELEAQNIVVERMRNKVNRLEELFVKMTAKTEDSSAA